MGRPKAADKATTKKNEVSAIQEEKTTPATEARILYQGTSEKLTSRGHGKLSYELGISASGENVIRIAGNESSGGFSYEWVDLLKIQSILQLNVDSGKSLSATALDTLFVRRSANNSGYLAAILATEGVLRILPGKPVLLGHGDWEPLLNKINTLKESGVTLTDHIATAAQARAAKRAELAANLKAVKAKAPTEEAGEETNDPPDNITNSHPEPE